MVDKSNLAAFVNNESEKNASNLNINPLFMQLTGKKQLGTTKNMQ